MTDLEDVDTANINTPNLLTEDVGLQEGLFAPID